jgi:hypothetical protein
MADGHIATAYHIASITNYAYVPELHFPELDEWAAGSGFTGEELALIQPIYTPCPPAGDWPALCDFLAFTATLLDLAFLLLFPAILAIAVNAIQVLRRRRGTIVPAFGVLIAFCCLSLALAFFFSEWQGFQFLTAPQYVNAPPVQHQYYFFETTVQAYGGIGLVSLGLGFLSGSLAMFRLRPKAKTRTTALRD